MGIQIGRDCRGYGDGAGYCHFRRTAADRLLFRGAVFREELVEGLAATDDRSAQRDCVRFARERPGAGLAGLLVPDAAVPVGIVLAVLEQRAIRFKPLPPRLAAGGGWTFARAGRADRGAGRVRGGGLHRDRLGGRPGRRGDRQ